MIPIIHTQWLNEEIPTDGHSPMHFKCDDGNFYYCKYRTQLKKEELDCLVYELVCHFLLKKLNIPTPDVALAIIEKDTYDIKKLKANKRYIKSGNICFASKEAANVILVTGIQSIAKKTQTNKFENFYDLLKIAMFDLWVDNADRGNGRKENYNLLFQTIQVQSEDTLAPQTKFRWLAFDHAFAFGGNQRLRMFNETMMPYTSLKLIESQYYKSFKKYFNPETYKSIVENFLTLQHHELKGIILNVFSQIPAEWRIPPNLADKIVAFLANQNRINSVKQLTLNSLKK